MGAVRTEGSDRDGFDLLYVTGTLHLPLEKDHTFFLKVQIRGKSIHFGARFLNQPSILNPLENKNILLVPQELSVSSAEIVSGPARVTGRHPSELPARLCMVALVPASHSVSGPHYLPPENGFPSS